MRLHLHTAQDELWRWTDREVACGHNSSQYTFNLARRAINFHCATFNQAEQPLTHTDNTGSFTDMKRIQRSLLQPTGAYYHVMVLFVNLRTCMDGGNQVSDTFGVHPPTINEYLAGADVQ